MEKTGVLDPRCRLLRGIAIKHFICCFGVIFLVASCLACCQSSSQDLSETDDKVVHRLDRKSDANAAALINKGQESYFQGKWEASLKFFEKASQQEPANEQALIWRSRALRELGRHDMALEILNKTVKLNPQSGEARFERASLYFVMQNFEDAEKDLAELTEQGEVGASLRMARALTYISLGRSSKALAELEMLTRVDGSPEHVGAAHVLLARILAASEKDDLRNGQRALRHAQMADALLAEKNVHVLTSLAMANAELGNYDDAVKHQEDAIRLASSRHREEWEKRLALYQSRQPYRAASVSLSEGFSF